MSFWVIVDHVDDFLVQIQNCDDRTCLAHWRWTHNLEFATKFDSLEDAKLAATDERIEEAIELTIIRNYGLPSETVECSFNINDLELPPDPCVHCMDEPYGDEDAD